MPAKAPSEGTKVTLGMDAPVTKEGTGAVASDSLAAESQTFRNANDVRNTTSAGAQTTTGNATSSASSGGSGSGPGSKSGAGSGSGTGSGGTGAGAGSKHVDTAPTYVLNQYHRDPAGPHGKNIKEDDSIGTEDKTKNTSFSEFGTKNDPAALAEKKIELGNSAVGGSTGGREKGVDGKTPYDALASEEQA
ncbi:Uu.00g132870.m01.CDS01 [Anthostomella pinea]|uniref:Uu.00g132870.m01.CDS01 n=1 Tax=Anthostomella pinea TaxID=933095 RepID=A0AAI8VSX8_9PEZI|nr:Uu.00g132870.m01.CDS01 [Anthostomella pinea]